MIFIEDKICFSEHPLPVMVTNDLFTLLSSIWITSAFSVGADIRDVTAVSRIVFIRATDHVITILSRDQ